ncbi:ABC transporter substrate-binding protein [Nonomuraea sp. KC401]|uniref:ABC transporter substrate-binding protein n=1 Tax=unclassified Nonomuraea TaxID=2593643 RepID=UPI0010FEB640|nr:MULTISPECIES: ABC transporter substrate-binding protein [unclassified Nonomuraea]NBE98896.1 extracellular solute-binding protein [Nonomuraea sp. K271]TLF59346.1 ABC transporter substrate-binding protein [Nonomuraea sp. KC401]
MRWTLPGRLAVTTVALLTVVSTGCAPSDDDSSGSGEVVRLTFWGDWSGEGEQQFRTMTDAFNKTHPGIRVEYVVQEDMLTKFLTASTSGQAPDVMFWDRWRTATYAPKNVLEPLDERMKKDGIDRERFYGEAVRELSHDGKVYGLPLTVDARALFYNKTHLKEAGVEPPRTWADLEEAAIKLTRREGGKLIRAGLSMDDVGLFSMYLHQAGGQMVTDDCSRTTFNSPQGTQALDLWGRMVRGGVYQTGFETGLGEGTDAFATGKVSMIFTGPWNITTYKKYGKDLDFGIVPPPAGPQGGKASLMGGFGLVIPRAAKQKDAAWEFVKWWTAEKANALKWAKTSLNIPGNVEAATDPFFTGDPFWRPILDTLEYAKVRPACAGYPPMEDEALIPNLQLFLGGKATAQQALAKSQEQGDRVLTQNNLD